MIRDLRDEDPVVLEETTTDAEGRFQIDEQRYEYRRGSRGITIVVWDDHGHIGGASQISPQSAGANPPQEIHIRLLNVQEYHGHLVDAAGQPIANAQVKPIRWMGGAPMDFASGRQVPRYRLRLVRMRAPRRIPQESAPLAPGLQGTSR